MSFDQRKADERIKRLERRLAHLEERIASDNRAFIKPNAHNWDKSEASALRFAIRVCRLAISNWPAGMAAVAEMEARNHDGS